jgi:hypothetical protein
VLLKRAILLVLLAGCPEETLPECDVIDPTDVVLVASDNSSAPFDITDGAHVPLIGAPQGGHILLVGARVRAAHDCQLVATASLRDPVTQRVLGLEERPLLLERNAHGWAVPRATLDAMPNVAVCPSAAASTPIFNHEYKLEVALATLGGEPITTATAMITPSCSDAYCESDCAAY